MPAVGGGTIAMYSNAIRGNALQPFPRMMACAICKALENVRTNKFVLPFSRTLRIA